MGTDDEPIAMADRLRDNLADIEDDEGGGQKAQDATKEVSCKDGEGGVDGCVADEEGAEEPVSMAADREDAECVALLLFCARLANDAQVNEVQRHEAEGEAREGAREDDANDCDHYLPP